jgi:hypothetical protein
MMKKILNFILVCEYYAHEDCKDFAVNDCRETATYVPTRDNVNKSRYIFFLNTIQILVNNICQTSSSLA